jgi:hypothetical protein
MKRLALLLAVAAVPAAAAATATPALAADGPASGICIVKGVPGVKPATIKAGVNISEASSKAADAKAACGNVSSMIKALAKTQAEKPTKVQGFTCTPSVTNNNKVAWKCVWKGGSPKATVDVNFGWTYTS